MNKQLLSLFFMLLAVGLTAQTAFISEIHYDDVSTDNDEAVEVYLPDPQPTDLTTYSIVLYNGSNGAVYNTTTLADFVFTDTPDGGYYHLVYPTNGIQNGPDAVAFVGPDGVIEFISYEGSFTAVGGPADGMTSTNIGVAENSGTTEGTSMQNDGFGNWSTAVAASYGEENSVNLPIELKSFTAFYNRGDIDLEWTTIAEVNNSHFNLLHSLDGRYFSQIATIDGNNNSSEEITYEYILRNVASGVHYFQLEQVDHDGKSEKFSIEIVKVDSKSISIFPTSGESTLNINGLENNSEYSIYTSTGQIVQTGQTNGMIQIDQLINGTYFLQVKGEVFRFFKI